MLFNALINNLTPGGAIVNKRGFPGGLSIQICLRFQSFFPVTHVLKSFSILIRDLTLTVL